ncbi:MAG TPA: BamA/TamA family outer membrane protein [bacterium]|nr:BamA/TamA family outer membrane protein [bacterium]
MRYSLVFLLMLLPGFAGADELCGLPPELLPPPESGQKCYDPGPADETGKDPKQVTDLEEKKKEEEKKEEEKDKDSGIVAFPIAFYTSDTSFGFGGTAILFKKSYETAEEKRSDSFTTVLFYTLNNQILNANAGTLYMDDGNFKANAVFVVSKYPDEFYGIGPDSGWDDGEKYTPLTIRGEVSFSARLWEKIYGGLTVLQGYHELMQYDRDGALADYLRENRTDGFFSGLGLLFTRDSRDNSLYPRTGAVTTFSVLSFNRLLLSDYTFSTLLFDHRQYHSLPLDSVIAWQLHLNSVLTGKPPLPYLPALGSQNLMRGYPQNRYRDRNFMAAQVEWRVPIWWRFGAVVFAGLGTVKGSLDDYLFTDPKFAAGAGLRITLSKKNNINFRFDFGMSAERPYLKLYFNLLEAF